MGSQPNIRLNIDQLVIDGMSRRQADRLQSALSRELGFLLPGLNAEQFSQHVNLSPLDIPVGRNVNPQSAGRAVARHIYRGLQGVGPVPAGVRGRT